MSVGCTASVVAMSKYLVDDISSWVRKKCGFELKERSWFGCRCMQRSRPWADHNGGHGKQVHKCDGWLAIYPGVDGDTD